MDNDPGKTRLERMRSWFENHPIFSVLMFLGTGLAAVSTLITSGIVILNTLGILNGNPTRRHAAPEQTVGLVSSPSPERQASDLVAASVPAQVAGSNNADAEVRRAVPVGPSVHLDAFYTPGSAPASASSATPTAAPSQAVQPDELVPVRRALPATSGSMP